MRVLTPDVESALRWFRWTCRLDVVPFVGARWVRDGWPADGGAGTQEAWLTHALELLADTRNAMLGEQMKKERAKGQDEQDERG